MRFCWMFLFLLGSVMAQEMNMDTLVGTWKFDHLNYIKVFNHVNQETLAALKDKMSKKHSLKAQGSELNLNLDSTFTMYQYDEGQIDTLTGDWLLLSEQNHYFLQLKSPEQTKKIRIKKVNGLELILIFQTRETIYESNWYYIY